MFDRIEFVITEALTALRRNPLMVFAGITTIAVSLMLIGGFGYLYYRAEVYASTLPTQFEMKAFVKDGVTGSALTKLQDQLTAISGVQSVVLVTKAAGWQKMQTEYPDITANIDNPLPDAFTIKLSDLQAADAVYATVGKAQGVDKVVYQADVLKMIRQGLTLLKGLGIMGLIFLITGGIVVYNAIRLTVHARRREIRIMQLVGASYATIRIPFMLEGLVQGAVGGTVAAVVLMALHLSLAHYIVGMGLALPVFPIGLVWLLLTVAGGLVGLVCSGWAIHGPLKAY